LFGFALKKLNGPDLERNITVVAWNTVIYGVLMLIADMYGRQDKTINEVTLKSAVLIGCAQALALSPGTSRSGVTMTAALSELHPSRCSSLLVSPRYPCYDRRSCSPWATP
jgi:undecaprenyl-diphosphatase